MKHRQIGLNDAKVINSDGHVIGIDLGAGSVRAAILAPGTLEGRPSVTVHGLGHIELPPGAVVNGIVVDSAAVTAALKQLWMVNKFECRNVVLGVTNQQISVRRHELPNLSAEQRAKALPYQARDVIAIPLEQAILDFIALGEPDPTTDMIPGLLIAAPREPIATAVAAVERAGLHVARVDLASFAVLRSIADEQLGVEAVVDMGAHLTTVVVHNQGVPSVVRTIIRGGQELTQRLALQNEMDLTTAEAAKCQVGMTGADPEVTRVLGENLRPLLAEIRASIHLFSSTNPGVLLERVSLTGGGALLPGLAQVVSDQLGLPTSVVPPLQHIRNRLSAQKVLTEGSENSATAVSVGLAMGAAA